MYGCKSMFHNIFFARLPGSIGRSVRSLRTTSWNWWDWHKRSNYRRRPFWKWTRITKQPYSAAIFCMFLVWNSLQVDDLSHIHQVMFWGVAHRGVRLLEHEEVLLSYNEKVSLHSAAITEGSRALERVEKEMRDLQLAVSEEKRHIDLKEKEMALWRKLEGEITTLQIEVRKARTLEHILNTKPKFGMFWIFSHQPGIDNV